MSLQPIAKRLKDAGKLMFQSGIPKHPDHLKCTAKPKFLK